MTTIKFSQLPDLPLGNIDAATYAPVVDAFTNYTVTMGNMTAYVNQNSGNISVTGTVSATGNITGNYILGNGSQLTGLPATYGNANVVANLAALGSNPVSTTGNITAGYFVGNGSALTGITGTYGNANVVANLAALGSNPVSTTGNITAGYHIGNGSLLTNLTGANVSGTVANATYATTAGSSVIAVTVTGNAQGNITSVGVLANLSVTGNVSANYYIGNGSLLTGIAGGSNAVVKIAGSFATGTFIANTTTETISAYTVIAANTFVANSVLQIDSEWLTFSNGIPGAGDTQFGNLYVNTSVAIPAAANLVASYTVGGTSSGNAFSRVSVLLDVISTTGNTRNFEATDVGINALSGYATNQSPVVYYSLDWSQQQYIIFTVNKTNNNAKSVGCVGYQVYKK